MSVTLAPLPGDASAIRSYGKRYEGVAERILDVSRALESLVSTERSQGESIDALKEQGRTTVQAIRGAQPRYHETALALVEFSVDLVDAQQKANSAIGDVQHGHTELGNLNHRRRRREEDRLDAMMANEPEDEIDRIQRDIRHLDREIDQVEQEIAQATNRYHHAVEEREKAIQEAIGRIRPALEQLNDGFFEFVRGAFESLVEFAEAVSQWVASVLARALDLVLKLLIVLIVAVAVVLLVLVLASILLLSSSFLGLITLAVLALIVLVITAIAVLVVRSIVREATAPTPEVVRVFDFPKVFARKDMIEDVDGDHPEGNYENIFNNNGEIDMMGGTSETDIEIVTIRDAEGNIVGYRVVLPSTQDWEEINGLLDGHPSPRGDQGAYNDLGSNIGLLTMPIEMRGPYQKAVIEALMQQMHDDGFSDPKQVPVMMTGFSQGGILAGRMAADPNSPFNITAVVVAGASIDTFPIPTSVSVLALQHPDDTVPKFDGNFEGKNNIASNNFDMTNLNQVTVTVEKEAGTSVHGANSYAQSAYETFDMEPRNPLVQNIVEQQSIFFSDNESVSIYATHE